MNIIQIRNVNKKYKTGVNAINDLSLDIEKGEFVFVIGSTGCGKSTLIKMLYREEKPTSGKIMLGGIDVARLRNNKVYKLRRKLGVVFQDFKLLPHATVYENVAFALEVLGLSKDEIHEKTIKALELVGLKKKKKNYPDKISGGEQQRTIIMVTHDTGIVEKMKKRVILLEEGRVLKDYKEGTYKNAVR